MSKTEVIIVGLGMSPGPIAALCAFDGSASSWARIAAHAAVAGMVWWCLLIALNERP